KEESDTIPGVVPSLMDLPPGCRFASRCKARIEYGLEICLEVRPQLRPVAEDHLVRCWIYHNEDGSLKTEDGRRTAEAGSGTPNTGRQTPEFEPADSSREPLS
ncbi:MAG TPA: oligopeptide/dipeptide ABC transporter ATP-binding protein, partial [Acidimicrobiia bacterium]|nr:oligopeptide/dipeptide ABC transporter ATP-binding protein [Acidimicrobiia bacterium]